MKDENGQIVKSRLDEERLRKIAEATGGFYVHLQNGPAEMQQIVRDGLGQDERKRHRHHECRAVRSSATNGRSPRRWSLLVASAVDRRAQARRAARQLRASAARRCCALSFSPRCGGAGAKTAGLEAYDQQDYNGRAGVVRHSSRRLPDSRGLAIRSRRAAYKSGRLRQGAGGFARRSPPPIRPCARRRNTISGTRSYQRGAAQKDKEPKIKDWKNALQHYDQALKIEPAKMRTRSKTKR